MTQKITTAKERFNLGVEINNMLLHTDIGVDVHRDNVASMKERILERIDDIQTEMIRLGETLNYLNNFEDGI